MIFIEILKSLLGPIWRLINLAIVKYELKKKYPTIRLLGNIIIKGSRFGKYNLILNASILDSFIDDFSYVASDSYINLCKIGKFTCIGPNVKIGLGGHPTKEFISIHPIFYSTSAQVGITFSDKNYFLEYHDTFIGNDVWIGANVIIRAGVIIGDGAIIASGSVVSKNVIPYAIVGGVPAKVIKMRFSDDEIVKLLKLNWWDKDFEWLKHNFKYFHSINNIDDFNK